MNNSRNDCWQKRCEKRCVRKTNRKKPRHFLDFNRKKENMNRISEIPLHMCEWWIECWCCCNCCDRNQYVYGMNRACDSDDETVCLFNWHLCLKILCAAFLFTRIDEKNVCIPVCIHGKSMCGASAVLFLSFFYSVKHFTETVQLQRHIKIARSFSHNKRNREKRWKYAINTKDGAIVRWKKEKSQLVDAGRRKPIVRWWKEKSNNQQTCLTFKLNKWTNYFFFVQTKLQQIEINMPDALRAFIDLNQRASTVTRIHTNILLSHKINLTNPHSNHINYTIALSNEQKHLIEVY